MTEGGSELAGLAGEIKREPSLSDRLPELGTLEGKQAASLAGRAPMSLFPQ
jgi:hypothetical protein